MSERMDVLSIELNKLLKKELVDLILLGSLPDSVITVTLIECTKKFNEKIDTNDNIPENYVATNSSEQIEVEYLKKIAIHSLHNQKNLFKYRNQ